MYKQISTLGSGVIIDAALSIDNTRVIVGAPGCIALHDAQSLLKLKHINIAYTPVKVAISPDKKVAVFATGDCRLYLLDLDTDILQELPIEEDAIPQSGFMNEISWKEWDIIFRRMFQINALTFSQDGKLLATGGHPSFTSKDFYAKQSSEFTSFVEHKYLVLVWDVDTRKVKYRLQGHDHFSQIVGLVFSDNSHYLVSWDDKTYVKPILWDMHTGSAKYYLDHPDAFKLIFSPDGKFVGSRGDEYFFITQIDTGIIVFRGSFGDEKTWDGPDWLIREGFKNPKINSLKPKIWGYTPMVESLAISSDNRLLAVAGDQPRVIVWDINSKKITHTLEIASDEETPISNFELHGLEFGPSNETILVCISSQGGYCLLWDVSSNTVKKFDHRRIDHAHISPDGDYLVLGGHGTAVYQIQDRTVPYLLWEDSTPAWTISVSPHGKYFACIREKGTLLVRDISNGDLLLEETIIEEYENSSGSILNRPSEPAGFIHLFFRANNKTLIAVTHYLSLEMPN